MLSTNDLTKSSLAVDHHWLALKSEVAVSWPSTLIRYFRYLQQLKVTQGKICLSAAGRRPSSIAVRVREGAKPAGFVDLEQSIVNTTLSEADNSSSGSLPFFVSSFVSPKASRCHSCRLRSISRSCRDWQLMSLAPAWPRAILCKYFTQALVDSHFLPPTLVRLQSLVPFVTVTVFVETYLPTFFDIPRDWQPTIGVEHNDLPSRSFRYFAR